MLSVFETSALEGSPSHCVYPSAAYRAVQTLLDDWPSQSGSPLQRQALLQSIATDWYPLLLIRMLETSSIEEHWIEELLLSRPWPTGLTDEYRNPLLFKFIQESRSTDLGAVWLSLDPQSLHHTNPQGLHVLDFAVVSQSPYWFEWLIDTLGLNPWTRRSHHLHALDWVTGVRWPQCLKEPYHLGFSPYSRFTQEHFTMLEKALALYPPVNPQDTFSLCLNLWKCTRRFHPTWMTLFPRGLGLERDADGRNALHWACHAYQEPQALAWIHYHLDRFPSLLNQQYPDRFSRTPLVYAQEMEYHEVARLLQSGLNAQEWRSLLLPAPPSFSSPAKRL